MSAGSRQISDPGALPPGTRLQHYRVDRILGAGSLGVVHEATDLMNDAVVALKTIRSGERIDVGWLKNEFREAAAISHPNIVSLYDLSEDDGQVFYTMERIHGAHFVDDARRHGIDRLRGTLAELITGVAALHERGLVHRDLKPENALVRPDGQVVLLDFDLVEALDAPSTGRVSGTLPYLAPEYLAGSDADPAAVDWFAVGVMLFEALTGELPWPGLGVLDPARFVGTRRPRELAPDAPADLDAICAGLLQADPGRRWRPAQVLEALGKQPEVASTLSWSGPLVAREQELATLISLLDGITPGRLALCRIEGEPGAGKSVLQEAMTRLAMGRGDLLCLRSRCHPQDRSTWKVFDPWIADLVRFDRAAAAQTEDLRQAGVLFPMLLEAEPTAAPRDDRRQATEALARVFGSAAPTGKLLLAVDDAQWGDEASGRLLVEILEAAPQLEVLLVCTLRRGEESRFLTGLRETARSRLVELSEHLVGLDHLAVDAAEALVRGLAGRHADRLDVSAIARESGGNPHLCVELVRMAVEGGHADQPTPTLGRLLDRRMAALPETARDLLRAACLAGAPVPQALLLQASGSAAPGRDDLHALRAAGLVQTFGSRPTDAIQPTHPRVRDAIVRRLDPTTRADLHTSLAEAMDRSGEVAAGIVAHHLEHAGRVQAAAGRYVQAARDARRHLAFETAVRHLRSALRLGTWPHRERQGLLVDLATTATEAGQPADAGIAWGRAADAHTGGAALRYRVRSAEIFLAGGHLDEGLAALRPILAQLDLPPVRDTAGALLAMLWHLGWLVVGPRRMAPRPPGPEEHDRLAVSWILATALSAVRPFSSNHLQLYTLRQALAQGDVHVATRALSFVGVALSVMGSWGAKQGGRLLEEGIALAADRGGAHAVAFGEVCLGYRAMIEGRWDRALAHVREGLEGLADARYPGATWERTTARGLALYCLDAMGRHAEVLSRATEQAAEAADRGDLYGSVVATQFAAFAELVGSRTARARSLARAAIERWPVDDFTVQHLYSLRVAVYADLVDGRPAEARHRLDNAWPRIEKAGLLRVKLSAIDLLVLRARILLSQPLEAPEELESLLDRLSGWDRAEVPAHLAALRAGRILASGGQAADAFDEAADAYHELGMALCAGCARRRAALLRGADTRSLDRTLRDLGGGDVEALTRVFAAGTPPG